MSDLGEFIKDTVQTRTRAGFDYKEKKFTKLSDKYIKQRRNMTLGGHAQTSKSNLNLTGSMVDSLQVKSSTNKTVIRQDGNKNRRKHEYQTTDRKQGTPERKFLALSTRDKTVKIKEFLINKITTYLKFRRRLK